ncbi:MAG: transposase [Alphaproteobacteria bacterium]
MGSNPAAPTITAKACCLFTGSGFLVLGDVCFKLYSGLKRPGWTRPYSEDLRERAVQRAEAGEPIRSITAALQISLSCVSKWRKRQLETGALMPGQMGGHNPRTLSGECADWLQALIATGPFTTRGLMAELKQIAFG